MVLEFVEGVRLDKIIQSTGVQPFRKVCNFLWHLGGALSYSHRKGYLHLNLRPTGVLVDYEGQPVISPFRFLCESEIRDNEDWCLCAEELKYQCPEQFGADDCCTKVSGLSDQYMLGLIAYEMIIGKSLIIGTSFRDIRRQKEAFMRAPPDPRVERPDCPEGLAKVVLRMLSTRPEDRWSHLEDAREEIKKIDLDGKLIANPTQRQAMHRAMESYNRCRESVSFVEDFYRAFFAIYPDVRRRFPADLAKQYYLLRESLDLILQFPTDTDEEPTTLTKVAESHKQRSIGPSLYDSFTNILIETVQNHDPWCKIDENREKIVDAWKVTVKPAVDYMKSRAGVARKS
jgi:serine/threonine protein kinase